MVVEQITAPQFFKKMACYVEMDTSSMRIGHLLLDMEPNLEVGVI